MYRMMMLSKLAFVHRHLWRADDIYRLSVLAGPAPLLGAAVAGALWLALHPGAPPPPGAPAWAKPTTPGMWNVADGKPQVVAPDAALPPREGQGWRGFVAGWQVFTRAAKVSPTMDVDVSTNPLSAYVIQGPTADMSDIVKNGPGDLAATPLYVATGGGAFVVTAAGEYSFALHVERPAGQRANCLQRFGFAGRRIVSNYDANLVGRFSKTSRPIPFALQPGLYRIGWAFGCWDGRTESDSGRITVLVRHPGDASLHPLGSDEIIFNDAPIAR